MPTDCKKERVNGMNLPLDFPGQERESFNLAKHSFIPLEGNGASCVIRKGVWRTIHRPCVIHKDVGKTIHRLKYLRRNITRLAESRPLSIPPGD